MVLQVISCKSLWCCRPTAVTAYGAAGQQQKQLMVLQACIFRMQETNECSGWQPCYMSESFRVRALTPTSDISTNILITASLQEVPTAVLCS